MVLVQEFTKYYNHAKTCFTEVISLKTMHHATLEKLYEPLIQQAQYSSHIS